MLRKRTRSVQRDQNHMGHQTVNIANSDYHSQSDALGNNTKNNSFFNVPGLFIGLSSKGLSDSDYSVWSPTSPLDVRVLSNLGINVGTPRPLAHDSHHMSWTTSKVGLSIIDSLEDCSKFSGKVLRPSQSKNIIFCSNIRNKVACHQSPPGSYEAPDSFAKVKRNCPSSQNKTTVYKVESNVLFEIGETNIDSEHFGKTTSSTLDSYKPLPMISGLVHAEINLPSGNFGLKDVVTLMSAPHFTGGNLNSNNFPSTKLISKPGPVDSANGFTGSLPASEIEFSEDYTCVISHGPNPKTTHIYGDCVLECNSNETAILTEKNEKEIVSVGRARNLDTCALFPAADFLSFCYHCNKKLEDGKDIFIYRGEKAFCSSSCRALEIMIDGELERDNPSSEGFVDPDNDSDISDTCILAAT